MFRSDGVLRDAESMTLGEALRRLAEVRGDSTALLSADQNLTWAELDVAVDGFAALLKEVGVQAGDVVGFMVTKRPEVVVGFLACVRIGAIMAPINFKLHPDHIRDQLCTAGIQAVVVESCFNHILKGVLLELPDPRKIIYVEGPGRHGSSWVGMPGVASAPSLEGFAPDIDTPCYYNYTSGTTGRPKGAITTHRNIMENAISTVTGLGFRDDDVFLGMFSVFAHPHELFHRSLVTGAPFLILDTLSPRVVVQAVDRFRVTWMMAVPSFYEMMLDHAGMASEGTPTVADISSLRVLESGGAYVGAETLARMERLFGARFLPVWGCTEATGVALANGGGLPNARRKPGATGCVVDGYEVKVVDERGRETAPGEAGEMVIRGPAMVSGYINNTEETEALFRDDWYYTRDLVRIDEDGFIFFVGRRSEMLKIGGIRVYPLEIEKVLKEHPEVRDVVVVRAEERVRGEVARAIVSTVSGSTLNARSAQQYCRDRLAVYKVPRFVEFWAEVPKMPNGKIDKRTILDTPVDPKRDER